MVFGPHSRLQLQGTNMLLAILLISLDISVSLLQHAGYQPFAFQTSIGRIVVETEPTSHSVHSEKSTKRPSLVFRSSDGKELRRVEFNVDEGSYSDVKFTLVKLSEFADSAFVVIAGSAGGSDSRFESTVVGIVNGRIRDLFSKHLFCNIQGALCIERSNVSDSTRVVLWQEIWGKEIHYAPHCYSATTFSWNGVSFVLTNHFETKAKYPTWLDAAIKSGFKSTFDYVSSLLPDFR